MAAKRPEELHKLFVAAFNAADLEGLAALYEADAVLATAQGAARGAADRRAEGIRRRQGRARWAAKRQRRARAASR